MFSAFRIPVQVKTDDGAPFNSEDFRLFAAYLGFKHRNITPRFLHTNGEIERFMKTLEKRCIVSRMQKVNPGVKSSTGSWETAELHLTNPLVYHPLPVSWAGQYTPVFPRWQLPVPAHQKIMMSVPVILNKNKRWRRTLTRMKAARKRT